MSIVPPRPGMMLLDIGCGTGKLLAPYSQKILPGGKALGIDIAPESIDKVCERARQAGLENIEARLGNIDTIVNDLQGQTFDLIVSSYAIFHATDMVGLIKDLRSLLVDQGQLFICGPGEGTNREMLQLLNRVIVNPASRPNPQQDFISIVQIAEAARDYASVETSRLMNEIRFKTPHALLGWWRNHSSHIPSADHDVDQAVTKHFKLLDEFRMTKNVLGVLFKK